jgi:hypothetical protein
VRFFYSKVRADIIFEIFLDNPTKIRYNNDTSAGALFLHPGFEGAENHKRRRYYASQNYPGLHRVQTAQLQHRKRKEEHAGQARKAEILPLLQKAHCPPGNEMRRAA